MTRVKAFIIAVFLVAGLAACSEASYSGDGNEFVALGKVTYVGRQSIGADIYDVPEANGKAGSWFDDDPYHVIHDNCVCKERWYGHTQTKVGHVEDMSGQEVDISYVRPGACVRFTGKIRSSKAGKTYNDRPVYVVARVINCDMKDGQ